MLWILTTSEDHVDENFYYLTGLSKSKQVTASLLVNGKNKLVLTNRLEHGLFKGKKIIITKREQFENIIRKYSHGKVGMNLEYISANSMTRWKKIFKHSNVVDISEEIYKMREVKTNSEIKKIKQACKITIDTLDDIEKLLKKSRTELDLAHEFNYAATKNGAEGVSFPTIVASGANSALAHHSPTNKKIEKGILLIDCGVIYDGYCSDITRTFYVGKADTKTKKVYHVVHKAQQVGIKMSKPGLKAKDAFNAFGKIIKDELGQDLFTAGHGLGIEVHDYPDNIASSSKVVFKKNMVITVEPGYYEKGWGGVRIEDDLVVGNSISITKAPSQIVEL